MPDRSGIVCSISLADNLLTGMHGRAIAMAEADDTVDQRSEKNDGSDEIDDLKTHD
jgi:hypothetical protein